MNVIVNKVSVTRWTGLMRTVSGVCQAGLLPRRPAVPALRAAGTRVPVESPPAPGHLHSSGP